MLALDDISASTEEQESSRSVGTFGLALLQTFIADQGPLLVTNESA
jgi:hypothetical protein